METIDYNDLAKRYNNGELVNFSEMLIKNYAEETAAYLSSIQPMPNDMKILMPDLLKDIKRD